MESRTNRHSSFAINRVILFLLLPLVIFPGTAGASQMVDKIIAIVNDDIITQNDLKVATKPYENKINSSAYSFEKKDKLIKKLHKETLARLIDEKLTDQEITKLKLSVSDEELDAAVEQIKQKRNMTDEAFIAALAKDGMSVDDLRIMIRRQMLRPRLLNYKVKSKVVITKEDIKSYYDAHPDEYAGEKEYHLKTILIPHELENGEDPLKLSEKVLSLFKKGEPFETLAKKYSRVPGASESGGDLGSFSYKSLSPQLKTAFRDLKIGECTPVLDTDHGYQIFYLADIKTGGGETLEEASASIEKKLYEEFVNSKFKEWIDELRSQAHIKIID